MADNTERIAELIREGKRIEAIKLLRETTGIGLLEASEQIDHLMAGTVPDPPQKTVLESGQLPPDVLTLVRNGQKIEAIKLLREKSGLGLKEAKARIDAVELAPRIDAGQKRRVRLILILVAVLILAGFLAEVLF